jgi:hypothetical protein
MPNPAPKHDLELALYFILLGFAYGLGYWTHAVFLPWLHSP